MLASSSDVSARSSALTDHFIRVTTAFAVVTVACVAAIISYQHAYELVSTHGEHGLTARLLPFTVDGLIWAASMVVLDASRRGLRVPPLAAWSLGVDIVATIGANLAHGLGHGPIGALVTAWPAVALIGSFELSPGVPSLLRDVALECPADSLCNTSRECGACCPRCSEALPARTCNKCNTLRGGGGKLIKDLPARTAKMS